jgi:hypothetical protein
VAAHDLSQPGPSWLHLPSARNIEDLQSQGHGSSNAE